MKPNKLYVNETRGRGGDNRDRIAEGTYVYRAYIEPFDGAMELTFTMRTDGKMELSKFMEQVADWLTYNDYWCPFAKALTVHFRRNKTSGYSKLICFLPDDIVTAWLWDYIQPTAENFFGHKFFDHTIRSAEEEAKVRADYERKRVEYFRKRGLKV